jgi:hypothetical protein
MVLSAPAASRSVPLDVNMEDKLQVLGIDIVDERGKLETRSRRAGPTT